MQLTLPGQEGKETKMVHFEVVILRNKYLFKHRCLMVHNDYIATHRHKGCDDTCEYR
jgi:hypothetical protein